MATFSASVDAWVRKTQERVIAVRNESAQRVVAEMQTPRAEGGNMRVDTGFLRASLQGATASMPRINPQARGDRDGTYTYGASTIALVIAQAKPDDTIYFGYTASYAQHRERVDGFVRLAAQNWQRIVKQVATEARQRAG